MLGPWEAPIINPRRSALGACNPLFWGPKIRPLILAQKPGRGRARVASQRGLGAHFAPGGARRCPLKEARATRPFLCPVFPPHTQRTVTPPFPPGQGRRGAKSHTCAEASILNS